MCVSNTTLLICLLCEHTFCHRMMLFVCLFVFYMSVHMHSPYPSQSCHLRVCAHGAFLNERGHRDEGRADADRGAISFHLKPQPCS